MITGQRVSIERGHDHPAIEGQLVAYVLGVGIGEGSVETRERIVVQTDSGRIVFADPRLIRSLAKAHSPPSRGHSAPLGTPRRQRRQAPNALFTRSPFRARRRV
jgi:hypothetical protein